MGVRVCVSARRGCPRPGWGPLVGALLALAALSATPALSKPTRVVSMNLRRPTPVALADRAHIASIGYLAVDANASALAEAARGLDINHGLAEEIIPLEPDLVLAGSLTTRPTVFLLRRLGYRVVELPVASTFDDIRANIRTVAEAIGERERGESIVASFDRNLASTTDSTVPDRSRRSIGPTVTRPGAAPSPTSWRAPPVFQPRLRLDSRERPKSRGDVARVQTGRPDRRTATRRLGHGA